jgi:hypothetical protein
VACGDSDSGSTTAAPQTKEAKPDSSKESESDSQASKEGGSQPQRQDDESSSSPASVDAAPLKVSGGGSGQYRTEGGDNSIQEFGEEGDEEDLGEAARAVHGYFVARANEDWRAACANLARTVIDQLDQLASQSENLKGRDCAGMLETLSPPLPATVRRESTVVDAGSLRLEGERAFLIYRGAKGTGYAIVMAEEDGGWKVGSLAATPIS